MKKHLFLLILITGGGISPAMGKDRTRITPVVQAFRKVKDAVVNIRASRVVTRRPIRWGFGDDLFDEIFQSPFRKKYTQKSLGSGFLIHRTGLIVTNFHVVARAEKISVSLANGKTYPAEVLSTDDRSDLALLRIRTKTPPAGDLPVIRLGDSSDLMIGETVIAVGNPFGYRHSLTTGVVSALDRELRFAKGLVYKGLIQTDASINPGNSGGPLLNIRGELIGINSAIRGDAHGIGFAISVNRLKEALGSLLDFEKRNQVLLGLKVSEPVGDAEAGVHVSEVQPGSPAHRAEVAPGDLLLAVDDKPLRDMVDYFAAMLDKKPGRKIRLKIRTVSGRIRNAAVVLTVPPRPDADKLAREKLGLTLRPISAATARRRGLTAGKFLQVCAIDLDCPLARAGMRLQDVLIQLGESRIHTSRDVGAALNPLRRGDLLKVTWMRTYRRGGMVYRRLQTRRIRIKHRSSRED